MVDAQDGGCALAYSGTLSSTRTQGTAFHPTDEEMFSLLGIDNVWYKLSTVGVKRSRCPSKGRKLGWQTESE